MPETGAQFGEFVLRREIGRGAMGTVWEAYQSSLDRTVALKVLSGTTASDPTWVKRFKAEAGAVAKLSHSGILPVYGIGETDGQHWFAMELVEGEDLGHHLAEAGPLTPRDAAKVIRHAAKALHHAHEHGVIHRDVKPANLMVRKDGRVTVTDFGLAKHVGSGALTTTGLLVGTPYYMSPELVTAGGTKEVGPACDVYGLGATLYELLTGTHPFDAPNAMALLRQIAEKDPKPPTQIDPKIPKDLETITLTCLRKRPDRRYPSALALAEDLNRFLEHQPITVRPPTTLQRLGRFAERNRLATGVAAVALVLLVGAVLFFTNALRSQEEDYERRIRELLKRADTLADAGKAEAAERLYTQAEKTSKATPEIRQYARQAHAGRDLARLLKLGALEPGVHQGAANWRHAPDAKLKIVVTPDTAMIVAQALRADGVEENLELPTEDGTIDPGLYRIELSAPGRVDSVVNLTAIPGMDAAIEVTLPEADPSTEGMVAYLGDWGPPPKTEGEPPPPGQRVNVRREGKAFLMDANPTTNAEYGAFLAAQPDEARKALAPATWPNGKPPADHLDDPVTGLTAAQGEAYAKWRGKRLPTYQEFQDAVIPDLIMDVASLQLQKVTNLVEDMLPPTLPEMRLPPEGAKSRGAPLPPTPEQMDQAEVHLLELQAGKETIAKLKELRDTLSDAKSSPPASMAQIGPWTWEQRFRRGNPQPALTATAGVSPGLRLVRDLPGP